MFRPGPLVRSPDRKQPRQGEPTGQGYAETLDPKARFFVDYRLPAYTYDKLSVGLIDAHEYVHDPMAMDVHEKLTRAYDRLPAREGAVASRATISSAQRHRLHLG